MSDNTERKEINLFDIAEIAANAESAAQSELDALENEASTIDVPIEKGEAAEEIQVEQQKEIKENKQTRAEEIDEAGEDSEVSLKSIIGGDILGSDWFRRQFFYIFFLGVLSILYVTNRYSYQSELLKQTKLKRELEDRRKRALVANSELTSFLRNKSILENLPDTTIHPTVDPFYYINLNEK